ncbi:Uncharacterized protein YgfA [Candidatus Providencia siddallii]|uniref:5-formyltetrahydrofolate cyclo-ligase n=1 Tax=Candidatus Providencia siddallii TaxID=1715285 RepID=A0A0M6W8P7_9GAMM|nr:Uncharacterized protein YgfA [Candidatus Providencia siddallii]
MKVFQKKIIRKFFRSLRRQLSVNEKKYSAQMIVNRILSNKNIINSINIGLFLSFDGEINTVPLINALWKLNKNIFLPCIHPFIPQNLIFLYYDSKTILIKNNYCINEPKFNIYKIFSIENLDVIIVPLVAFDNQRNRLGMGGGFYDKILENWEQKKFYPIGIAYDCQKIEDLCIDNWDVQLPEIITPQKIW